MSRAVAVVLPIAGARVYVDDVTPPGGHAGVTDQNGYVEFVTTDLMISYVSVKADGYNDYYQGGLHFPPGNFQIRIGVDADPARPNDLILPPMVAIAPVPTPIPYLEIRGVNFVDPDGVRIVLKGTDQFKAYRDYLDGIDLTPLVNESKELGFNMWRVFLMGSSRQNGILELRPTDPGFYDYLTEFATYLNTNGIIPLATVFVDAQDIIPNKNDQLNHWLMVADRLRYTATLLSGGNEWHKNGFNPGDLRDPGMLWSRGSDVADAEPFKPWGSFVEFHPRRDLPAMLLDSVASPVTLYNRGFNVPIIIDEPIGFAEENQPGRRSNDPNMAWRLARHYSTETGGTVFHNDSGMRGLVMGATIKECAKAWIKGLQIS